MSWREGAVLAEWVDGEIIEMSPASTWHQRIGGFLYAFIRIFVERHQLGEVFFAPYAMRLNTRPSWREPDLLFVAEAHADRVKTSYLDGPADLAIEIVSPESEVRDRHEKYLEYESAGVPEYWLIDEPRHETFFYVLGEDGRYHLVPIGDDGIYTSTVLPGFRLRVTWLWQWPLPTLDTALADLPT